MAKVATSHNVTEEIYGKSGDINKHLDGVKKQYDTAEKRDFYAQVMGDGTCCAACRPKVPTTSRYDSTAFFSLLID